MSRVGRWIGRHLILFLGLLVLLYLFAPIFVVMLMSFNAAEEQAVLHVRRFHLGQLAASVPAVRAVRRGQYEPAHRPGRHHRGYYSGHAAGVRDGPSAVPRPGGY